MRIDALPIFRFLNPILISILFYYPIKLTKALIASGQERIHKKIAFPCGALQSINKQINESIFSGHSDNLTPIHQQSFPANYRISFLLRLKSKIDNNPIGGETMSERAAPKIALYQKNDSYGIDCVLVRNKNRITGRPISSEAKNPKMIPCAIIGDLIILDTIPTVGQLSMTGSHFIFIVNHTDRAM